MAPSSSPSPRPGVGLSPSGLPSGRSPTAARLTVPPPSSAAVASSPSPLSNKIMSNTSRKDHDHNSNNVEAIRTADNNLHDTAKYSYNCQKCHQPLILDPTVLSITPSQIDDFRSRIPGTSSSSSSSSTFSFSSTSTSNFADLRPSKRLSLLPSPEASKTAYLQAILRNPPRNPNTAEEPAIGTVPERRQLPIGSESYVILPPSLNHGHGHVRRENAGASMGDRGGVGRRETITRRKQTMTDHSGGAGSIAAGRTFGPSAQVKDNEKGKDKGRERENQKDGVAYPTKRPGDLTAIPTSTSASDSKPSHCTTSSEPSVATPSSPPPSALNLTSALFDLISSKTPVDHPICEDCAKRLQEMLQDQLDDLQRERDAYIYYEKEWTQRMKRYKNLEREREEGNGENGFNSENENDAYRPLTDEEWLELEEEKRKLNLEYKEMVNELARLEDEEAKVKEEERLLEEQEKRLLDEETRFLIDHQRLESQIKTVREQIQTEKTRNMLAAQTLSRLESTNVYNDVFQIGHVPLLPSSPASQSHTSSTSHSPSSTTHSSRGLSGSGILQAGTAQTVGTINGLRLGGRPLVDWTEINAALGMVALCIDRIAAKVGCTFEQYKIVPLGSFSRVDELPPSKNCYELYASTDISPSRLLQNRRFNYALGAMLDCLRQLVEFGKVRNRGWAGGGLDIQKDKIGGHSIKLTASMGMSAIGIGGSHSSTDAEESWTRALRAVLAVLKRILVLESEADRDSEIRGST